MSQDQTAATSSPFGNNAAILAQAANDIRTQAITKAVPKRNSANAVEPSTYPTHKWTIQMLEELGEFDTLNFIKLNAQAHQIASQHMTDITATRIPQRCVGSLNASQIEAEQKIGTDNLQQCVAVVVHGFTKTGEEKAMLMHIDRYTSPESIKSELIQFQANQYLKIGVYGGRDQVRSDGKGGVVDTPQREVSLDNLRIIDAAIEQCGLKSYVDQELSKRGPDATSPNFIYFPHELRAIERCYPNGGYELADATAKVRVAKNILQERSFSGVNPTVLEERTAPLLTISTKTDLAQPYADIEPSLKQQVLKYYRNKGCSEYISAIEEGQSKVMEYGNKDLLQACSSCQNFMMLIQESLQPAQVTLKEIYEKNRKVSTLVTQKIEACDMTTSIHQYIDTYKTGVGHGRPLVDSHAQMPTLMPTLMPRGHGRPLDDRTQVDHRPGFGRR